MNSNKLSKIKFSQKYQNYKIEIRVEILILLCFTTFILL